MATRPGVCCCLSIWDLANRSEAKETQKTYLALKQPPLRPPPEVFGPVWTLLYGLMGYAANRAWTSGSLSLNPATRDLARHGATLYSIQLGLNLIWMPLFFGIRRPIEAAVDIVALTGTTAYLAYIWSGVDEVSSWCLAPYLGWLGFATYLTVSPALECSIAVTDECAVWLWPPEQLGLLEQGCPWAHRQGHQVRQRAQGSMSIAVIRS